MVSEDHERLARQQSSSIKLKQMPLNHLEPNTPRSMVSTRVTSAMEDPDGVLASVAQCIEELRGATVSPNQKEQASKRLTELVEDRESSARKAVSLHTGAIPVLVNVLRTGTPTCKTNVAAVVALICKEDELRMKVLLGGCIPPLLTLLKQRSTQSHSAAAKALYAVTSSPDHVGAKIFSTEGVVPRLWEEFEAGNKLETSVLGLLTGALRNLCNSVEGFWEATLEAGGIEVLVALLRSSNTDAQANACYVLSSLMTAVESCGAQVFNAGATDQLFKLLGSGSAVQVRAESASALSALTLTSSSARQYITSNSMVRRLIAAVVAPSKEFMQGNFAQQLQEYATSALSNVLGGMIKVVGCVTDEIKRNRCDPDSVGALAYALMVIRDQMDAASIAALEMLLVGLALGDEKLKGEEAELVQEHAIEALASLYGNPSSAPSLEHAEAKKMLVGVATLADPWVRVELVKSLEKLCSGKHGLWESIRGRDGVQFMISLLGVSSEQQQEYAVALLSILSIQIEDSNWAITASGGIPPLVQLLETGSQKARQDSAIVLANLCSHSDDIRACVQTAQAEAALLWLLKNAGDEGQEIAARAIVKLVVVPDSNTMSQLTAMVVGELPSSKRYVLEVMSSLLLLVPESEISKQDSAAHEAVNTLVSLLQTSTPPDTLEKSTSVLADIVSARPDVHESELVRKAVGPLSKLLVPVYESEMGVRIAGQAARALGGLFSSILLLSHVKEAARDAILPLVELTKAPLLSAAESAVLAVANLLLNPDVGLDVPLGEMIEPLTRILEEGNSDAQDNAAVALARMFAIHLIDEELLEHIRSSGTMLVLARLLQAVRFEHAESSRPLEALSSVARSKINSSCSPKILGVLSDEQCLTPLVECTAVGGSSLCEHAIHVLSKLCGEDQEQHLLLARLISTTPGCISALADRIVNSDNIQVKIGGADLIICAARKHGQQAVDSIKELVNGSTMLIHSLVGMLGSSDVVLQHTEDSAAATAALWLLSVIAAHVSESKVVIMEAGAIDVLADKLAIFAPNARQAKVEESGSNWISALLLAILFQDRDVSRSPATLRAMPPLSMLLKSDDTSDRYFSAAALASLVCHGSRGTLLAVANSGAVSGLISLLGSSDVEAALNLSSLSQEFSLAPSPEQVALERLFRVDDIRFGATARKAIPALVELLKPIPGRPNAAPLALSLLTQVAEANNVNRLSMGEASALEALTKYLSLGPQDSNEEAAAELLRILFTSSELRRHDSALGAVEQLTAVLRLGARGSRYTAARALEEVFVAEQIKCSDIASQAVVPLIEMLNAAVEREQHAAIGALISLASDNPHKAMLIGDNNNKDPNVKVNTLEVLARILSDESTSFQLKEHAADLCSVLFANARVRSKAATTACVPPLVDMLVVDIESARYSACRALDNVLDDEQQAEAVAAYSAVVPLVDLLIVPPNSTVVSTLIKLGKDRPLCKLDMVKAGVIDRILSAIPYESPEESEALFFSLATELLRILTNNSSIAKSASACRAVEPLFVLLSRSEALGVSAAGQISTVQTLVNILEKPETRESSLSSLATCPANALVPLLSMLDSSHQSLQQVSCELLSYLLLDSRFQQDPLMQSAVPALVKLTSAGAVQLQNRAVQALESASAGFPDALVECGGVSQVSKIIEQTDPPAPHAVWESAAKLLSNVLQTSVNPQQYCHPGVIAKLLRSSNENTVSTALHALLLVEKEDASTAEIMAESGAIESLVEILRWHNSQCDEAAARLLESLVNNVKVRGMKTAKLAICPLADFLLDAQTQCSEQSRLLAALALGDLFQNDNLCKSSDAVSACRALVSLLEGQHSEEIQMVAICALQNLVVNSRPNKRAVAEAGGVQALQEILAIGRPETAVQAASLIRILFSNHTVHEFASVETLQALLALLEKDLWSRQPVQEEIVKSINTMFNLFPQFRMTEVASASIPLLIGAMKSESEIAQEAALDTLFIFTQTWPACSVEDGKAQANAMADAIPVLQMLMRTGPQRFHERIEIVLQCLPGNLLVNIKRGNNLRQSMGGTNAFCKITLGNGPPRQTRVVSNNSAPQWEQGFAWAFDTPPKGQKLRISCKNKGAFGKGSLGKVSIQIDRVVMLGTLSGEYQLKPEHNRDGTPRTLEIEFQWSNR